MSALNAVEWVLVMGLLAMGLTPLLHARRVRWRRAVVPGSCALLLAGAGAALWLPAPQRPQEPPPAEVLVDGYVSSRTCRSCHPREYEAWHASYHRTMTQRASAQIALGDFDDVELELDGVRYRLFRRGDDLWANWAGADHQLVLSTGSHHDQMYWYESDRGEVLEQFAFDYSRRLARWIPTRASFLIPPRAKGRGPPVTWMTSCSRCHAVHPPRRLEAPRQVAELGIACEACHGPAAEHVAAHRNPARRLASRLSAQPDPTIVQPQHLDSRRAAETCGQCHGAFISEAGPYRPGEDLQRTRLYYQQRYLDPDFEPRNARERERARAHRAFVREQPRFARGTFWSDGVVRVSGREYSGLLESPCFERGEMDCSSCHTLHRASDDPRSLEEWANDQVSVGMEGNGACLQCHDSFSGAALAAHTRHEPESTGSLCYNCHMSYSVYGIQKAHRSHTVASPSVAESVEVGRPNACNQCHLDRTLAWSAEHLDAWYGTESPALSVEVSTLAAGVLWTLRGDAGMRALMAWTLGWPPAREASGAQEPGDWMIPYLAQLLDDPYDAVRFIALLSLRKRAEFADFDYDFAGTPSERRAASERAGARETYTHSAFRDDGALLLDASGRLDARAFARLLEQRDHTPLLLRE